MRGMGDNRSQAAEPMDNFDIALEFRSEILGSTEVFAQIRRLERRP
jgi:hypothetical protein